MMKEKADHAKANGKPTVFSYSRFSSAEQSKGDSERRQWDAAQAYAREHGFTFDESLRMTDRGLSGYHGAHRKKGALGVFLERVKSGDVPPGSILVVENIDRLGREPVSDALETILTGLFKHHITVETLFPRDTFTRQSINTGGIWRLIAHIERANAESQRKSDLGSASWRQKRKLAATGVPLTRRIPAWLRIQNGKFSVIPEAAKTVNLIYKLKLGGLGKLAIERKLNAEAPWRPANGWRGSYIEKILRTQAVIGEYQPHSRVGGTRVPEGEAIPDYFPPVVDPKLFHAVQSRPRGKGGRTGKASNIFRHLARCGYCDGPMVYIDKGRKSVPSLTCDNGRRGLKCRAYKVPYAELEETILGSLRKLRPEAVLPDAGEQATQAKSLRESISGLSGQLADVETRIGNLVDQIERTSNASIRARYEKRVEEMEAAKPKLETERTRLEDALRGLERGGVSFAKWQRDLAGLKAGIAKDTEARVRLNAHLREFIARVDVFASGTEEDLDRAEDVIQENRELLRSPALAKFREFLRRRILSPDGRCFRIIFRGSGNVLERVSTPLVPGTGKPGTALAVPVPGVQVAPEDSLAYSWGIEGSRDAAVDRLYREFFDGRKPGEFTPKKSLVRRK